METRLKLGTMGTLLPDAYLKDILLTEKLCVIGRRVFGNAQERRVSMTKILKESINRKRGTNEKSLLRRGIEIFQNNTMKLFDNV